MKHHHRHTSDEIHPLFPAYGQVEGDSMDSESIDQAGIVVDEMARTGSLLSQLRLSTSNHVEGERSINSGGEAPKPYSSRLEGGK